MGLAFTQETLNQVKSKKITKDINNINNTNIHHPIFSFGKEKRVTDKINENPGPGAYKHLLYTGNEGKKISMGLKYKSKIDEKLKRTKSFYEDEIKKIKTDFQKEKDNYALIIKIKDEEIMKLVKNKEDIKAQEGKKYEKIISKYEQIAKEKDTEIEILKLKNKKLNINNKIMQSKQENAEK